MGRSRAPAPATEVDGGDAEVDGDHRPPRGEHAGGEERVVVQDHEQHPDEDLQAADHDRRVVSVNGDGGFSWTLQELSTARRYDLPLVALVFEDGYFGNVRRIQRNDYGGRYFASDLTNPDYARLAEAFGVASASASSPDELAALLPGLLAARRPVLVHVPVGEMPSPWHLIHEGLPRPMVAEG